MRFSERHGYAPVRSVLQTNSIDTSLRNRIWNLINMEFFEDAPTVAGSQDYLPNYSDAHSRFMLLSHHFFKEAVDEIPLSYYRAVQRLRTYFFGCQWYSIYDLIEFLANSLSNFTEKEKFIRSVNAVLKDEMAGYRFVSGRIVQITSEEEVACIEQAVALPHPLKPVTTHLRQALALLAEKKDPDYRNSIKESISAIESLSKILSGLPNATLSPALNAVEKHAKLHPSLKEAFQKVYGYSSDAQGIRHALMDEPTLDLEDAKFMLVSCSAFVNYMVVKAQKADIKI